MLCFASPASICSPTRVSDLYIQYLTFSLFKNSGLTEKQSQVIATVKKCEIKEIKVGVLTNIIVLCFKMKCSL